MNNNNEIKLVKLQELCNVYPGKTPSTKEPKYWDNENGYNWLTIKDITNNNVSTERKISKYVIKNINMPITDNKSLLFSFKGTFSLLIPNSNYRFNEAICDLRVNKNKIIREYLMYFLKTQLDMYKKKYVNTILSCLSKQKILDLDIPLPPLKTQNLIVKRIQNLELSLHKLKQLLHKLKQLLHKLKQLLHKLPNYAMRNVWKYKLVKLQELINIKVGNAKYTKKYIENNPGKYPVYSSSIYNNGLSGKINSYEFNGEYGTYTKDGNAGYLFYRNEKFNLSNSFAWNTNKKTLLKYVFYFLKANEEKIRSNIKSGATIKHFYPKDLYDIKIPLPPLKIQNKILNYLHPFYTKLDSLSKKIESLINNYDNLYKRISNSVINKEINKVKK